MKLHIRTYVSANSFHCNMRLIRFNVYFNHHLHIA